MTMYNFTPQRCTTTRKIMYKTKEQAQTAARNSYAERGVQLWVYVCEYCRTWHLTSRPPIQESLRNASSASGTGNAGKSGRNSRSSWGGKPIVSRKKGFKPRKH